MKYMGTRKKSASQTAPGARSPYGSSRRRTRIGLPSAGDRLVPGLLDLLHVLLVSRWLLERLAVGDELVVREDQRVLRQGRIALLEDLLHPCDRRDVVDERRDVGLDLGLVGEVHELERRRRVRGAGRDRHHVEPDV